VNEVKEEGAHIRATGSTGSLRIVSVWVAWEPAAEWSDLGRGLDRRVKGIESGGPTFTVGLFVNAFTTRYLRVPTSCWIRKTKPGKVTGWHTALLSTPPHSLSPSPSHTSLLPFCSNTKAWGTYVSTCVFPCPSESSSIRILFTQTFLRCCLMGPIPL
jgi:hypothetical protein